MADRHSEAAPGERPLASRLASRRAGWRGEALPEWMRLFLEERLAADLGEVRFHGGRVGGGLCRLLRAGAVTFGRRVFVSPAAARRLASGGRRALALAAHEAVHVLQYRRDGFVPLVLRYVREYLGGRLRGLSHHLAYRSISYEREAFAMEEAVLHMAAGALARPLPRDGGGSGEG